MPEYKNTLNLPTTDFSMKANLSQKEPARLAVWQEKNIYQYIRAARQDSPAFILHDGPPYANGNLHCGHALNKILKDIIVKSKTLSGINAPFVPGWDCHGLPIELNVEKKFGKAGVKLSAKEFRAKCRNYAATQIEIQKQEFKRLGVLADWHNPYTTSNFTYEANIVRALGTIIKNGHLQQGFKPVHWCIECSSALAEAEVDYENKISDSIDVMFSVVNATGFSTIFDSQLTSKPITVPIWTTTPWSLLANEAVCLHPTLRYQLIDTANGYFLIAADLVASSMARYGIEHYTIKGEQEGKAFFNTQLQHPFLDKNVPIIYGEHVTTESGTGCVHTAPAHGPDDYLVGKKFSLPLENPVQSNGCYKPDVAFFAGQSVVKVNGAIIALLNEKKTLLLHEKITHSYPHCWRHKTPVIFLATPQWFISMDKNGLREAIIHQINTVNWIPDWGKPRIIKMIENRPDWCISRQRAWGTPLPLFVHKHSRELHPESLRLVEKVAQLIEVDGVDAWFDLDVAEFLGADHALYDKITDTLDVWFDSGVSHFCVLNSNSSLGFPADMYFEGSDQHRGWFNSSITTAVAMYGVPPYKTVLTHGFTVDAEGKKLSKSKGNYVALDKIINQHGADIIRLWVASTDYRNEVGISDEIISRNADAYRRIRNTARFLLANLFDFTKENTVASDNLVAMDKWIIARTQQLQQEIITAYNSYNFHTIYQKIHNFCAMDLGGFYLDVIKDRQYTTPKNSIARRSCQTAMYYIIHALTRWLAPIISFTADELWQAIPEQGSTSIFTETWFEDWPIMSDVDLDFWHEMQRVRNEVNKALELKRQSGLIGSPLAAEVTIYACPNLLAKISYFENELRFLLITSKATVKPLDAITDTALLNDELQIAVDVQPSSHEKCARCWHRCENLSKDDGSLDLCARCADNISGNNEVRLFA